VSRVFELLVFVASVLLRFPLANLCEVVKLLVSALDSHVICEPTVKVLAASSICAKSA
jgi:hypothetical protein